MSIDRYQTLIPRPRQADSAAGEFVIDGNTGLQGDPAACDAVRLLLGSLRVPLLPDSGGITARVDPTTGGAEAYRLTVRPDGIELVGADLDGVRDGTETLRQLLPDSAWRQANPRGGSWTVPCGQIADEPALSWRGGMIDVSRHFFPKRTILRYVDLFAMHHLNRLHLHLTDDQGWRIESRKYPRLQELASHRPNTQLRRDGTPDDGTPHGGYYTLDDLSEIGAYAADRGVTIVPEIDLPGHVSALLTAYPEYGSGATEVLNSWGIAGGVLRPLPRTVDFIADLLDELLDALPTPYVHLGGDECILKDWSDDPEIMDYLREIGGQKPADLHGHFLRQLGERLSARGVRMVVWDEAFVTGGVLPDSIVAAWRGDSVARRAAEAGYDVVRCPVVPTYLNYDQSDDPEEPISQGGPILLQDVAEFSPQVGEPDEHIIGLQFQAWSEYIDSERHLDYLLYPRSCLFADIAWRGEPIADFDPESLRPHLGRLAAAGVEYRPLEGSLPWQRGGTGIYRRRPAESIAETRAAHEEMSTQGEIVHD